MAELGENAPPSDRQLYTVYNAATERNSGGVDTAFEEDGGHLEDAAPSNFGLVCYSDRCSHHKLAYLWYILLLPVISGNDVSGAQGSLAEHFTYPSRVTDTKRHHVY